MHLSSYSFGTAAWTLSLGVHSCVAGSKARLNSIRAPSTGRRESFSLLHASPVSSVPAINPQWSWTSSVRIASSSCPILHARQWIPRSYYVMLRKPIAVSARCTSGHVSAIILHPPVRGVALRRRRSHPRKLSSALLIVHAIGRITTSKLRTTRNNRFRYQALLLSTDVSQPLVDLYLK